MLIKGTIENVKFLKSGHGQRGPWSMFEVTINGQRYTTFDKNFQNMVGQQGEFEYKEEQRQGRQGTYMARTVFLPRKGGANTLGPALQSINEKLDKILAMLSLGKEAPMADDPGFEPPREEQDPQDGGMNIDDIPF